MDLNELLINLEHDSTLLVQWFEENYMKLNKEKCHLLVSGHKYEHIWIKINKKDCVLNICSQHWDVNDSNTLVPNLIKISRNYKLIFIRNGFQIRIPRPKICMCWKFQVHTAKRKATLIKACLSTVKSFLILFFPQKSIFLKNSFVHIARRSTATSLDGLLGSTWSFFFFPFSLVYILARNLILDWCKR